MIALCRYRGISLCWRCSLPGNELHPSQQPGQDGGKAGEQHCVIIVRIPGCKVGTFPLILRFRRVSPFKHKFRAESVWTGCFLSVRNPSGAPNNRECGHLFPHCFAKCVNSTYHPLAHLQRRQLCICGTEHVPTRELSNRLFLRFSQQSSSNVIFFLSLKRSSKKMKWLWGL